MRHSPERRPSPSRRPRSRMSQGPPNGHQGHPGPQGPPGHPQGPPPPMMHLHPMQMHPMMMQQMMMEQNVQAPPAPKDDEPTPICRYVFTYISLILRVIYYIKN